MDIRQSSYYQTYLEKIGWKVEKIGNWRIFTRKIPLYGWFAKLQKIKPPFPFMEIENFVRKKGIRKLVVEPDSNKDNLLTAQFLARGYKINHSPFLPTKTILISLKPSEEEIFNSFSPAKRRAIRKAQKNNIRVVNSFDIKRFIGLKTRKMFPISSFMAKDIKILWDYLSPQNAALLLSLSSGVLLLFDKEKAYYWLAGAEKEGKKAAAPSLLVWEAVKLAKKRGCQVFDFEGIYDGRFPEATRNWQGFTRFKKGFGGSEINYLGSFVKTI